MANTTIALKKSSTPAAVPAVLANGELALNFADGKLYYKNVTGQIVVFTSTGNSYGIANVDNTLILSGTGNDVLNLRSGNNISLSACTITKTIVFNGTGLANATGTLAGALTTTSTITANGVVYINPVGGQEGGELQLLANGANTNWTLDSYQNNYRIFATTGSSVSNVTMFHSQVGGSVRVGVNRADPGYALDVFGQVNASAFLVNGSPIGSGSMDYAYVNTTANVVNTTAYVYANGTANSANAWSNTKLANTSGVAFAGNLYFPAGNVSIGYGNDQNYRLAINGSFVANTKSFVIPHPTKENMTLRHGSLEGPENGVYVRGLCDTFTIELPDYWIGLVHEDSITVCLTPIGYFQRLYVDHIEDNVVYVMNEDNTPPYCHYHIFAERKDVDKLIVEY